MSDQPPAESLSADQTVEETLDRGYTKPALGSGDWHIPLNENFDLIHDDVQSLFDLAPRFSYIVSKRDGLWRAVSRDGSTVVGDESPAPVVQFGAERGDTLITTPIIESNGDLIDTTITVPSALVDGGFNRIEGSADPIFSFGANAKGIHNARIGGRLPGGGKPTTNLLRFDESGQRSFPFMQNVTLGFSFGWGAVIGGVQQTYLAHVQVDRLGHPDGGGGGLLFTDNDGSGPNPPGHLGSNSFTVIDLQAHGSATYGPIIASRTLHGGSQALNGMKLRGLDIENGNQSGVGGPGAENYHVDLRNALRLKFTHVYMRGLSAADAAINYNFSNGNNVLEDAEIRYDPEATGSAGIRKYRGGSLTLSRATIEGAGAPAVVGDMRDAGLSVVNDSALQGALDVVSQGSGGVTVQDSSVGTVRALNVPLTLSNATVAGFTAGNNQFKNIITRGGDGLTVLNPLVRTGPGGTTLVDWESNGILFDQEPIVRTDARGPFVAYVNNDDFQTATYDGVTYWTGVRVNATDLSETPAENVDVDVHVEAAP